MSDGAKCWQLCSGQPITDVATTIVDNLLPGLWQCGHISSNACGWDGIEEGRQLIFVLCGGGVHPCLCLPQPHQPLLHFSIQLAMYMLNSLVAVRAVGWMGQELPAWAQNLCCLVVSCGMVNADDKLLTAPQP